MADPTVFSYSEAFNRNLGWLTEWEQQSLRHMRVAIAGMGGVGGAHLVTLARLGIGAFHIADMDQFEISNINRQTGAALDSVGRDKVEVLAAAARNINPEITIKTFPGGIDAGNLDEFLDGVDLFVDGLDFFVLDIRAQVFARCHERGIPAITAAPLGMGTAYLIFMPGGMTFEEYFRLEGLPPERQFVNFLVGLNPKGYHRAYLVDPPRIDFANRRGPSTAMACQLCAGVVGAEAVRILLGRGGARGVPGYHQFDPYRRKWIAGRIPGGNRNPLQMLKCHLGYRTFARLSHQAAPAEPAAPASEIGKILDIARWAPSGDNSQPWRFEITGADRVLVHVEVGENVYEYDQGQPTLLSAGFLLETMRIAASSRGRSLAWSYRGASGRVHTIDVELRKDAGIPPDPLLASVAARSVDRRPYRTGPLKAEHKQLLEAALGKEFEVRWHETVGERWAMARLNALATDIRLRIPEAFAVHRQILDWQDRFSRTGVPAGALGLDRLTLGLMRWAMGDWRRMRRLNALPGGTLAARLQMDYLPGLFCAAHVAVARRTAPEPDDAVPALLGAGQALQRFWLTATRLGLVMQPSFAPLCFAHHGGSGDTFTESNGIRRQAAVLAERIAGTSGFPARELVFMGRLGRPRGHGAPMRSVRRPLADLLVPSRSDAS